MSHSEKELKERLYLAELITTRVCHDLAGPIGAFNNGVELLEEGGEDMAAQAVELLAMSAREARAKLQLFRIAFGVVNYQGTANPEEVHQIVAQYFAHSKVKLEWQVAEDMTFFTTELRRMVACMVLVVAGSLLVGGVLKVRAQKTPTQMQVEVHGEGPKVKHDEETLAILTSAEPPLQSSSRAVPAHVLRYFAQNATASVKLEHSADFLKINLVLPVT